MQVIRLFYTSTIISMISSISLTKTEWNTSKESYSKELAVDFITSSNYKCPDNLENSNNHSLEVIEVFLNSEGYEIKKNNDEIAEMRIEQVTVMKTSSDGYACNKLNSFADQWLDRDSNWKYTYYKVGSTYFLSRWYDGNILGFSPLFVFNSSFELISAGAY